MKDEAVENRCLIIKTGETIDSMKGSGDFEDWIADGLGVSLSRCPVCRVDRSENLPPPEGFAAAVITGSSAMVSHRLAWSLRTGAWLREAVKVGLPLLGICYGHQLLAQAFGAPVDADPRGREIGTVRIRLRPEASDDPLFERLPELFPAQATHEESVLRLPEGAVHLASTEHTPIHAFRIGESAWGVQFHPEFGAEVMQGYIRARASKLEAEGLDPEALAVSVKKAPDSESLLRIFADFAGLG